MHFGFVINEHGGVEGIATITDLMQAIVGRLPDPGQQVGPPCVQRPDGSWLVDGAVTLADVKEVLPIRHLPREEEGVFSTVGGFVMTTLSRVPHKGDRVQAGSWEFEVMEMDGNRVDEVLVSEPGNGKPPDPVVE
jgi:putative hemolysin